MCVKHESIIRSQSFHFIVVIYSFQLMSMNFIDPLNSISAENKFILNLDYYMSRFNVSFAYKINNIEKML